jgi:hypothetical protein
MAFQESGNVYISPLHPLLSSPSHNTTVLTNIPWWGNVGKKGETVE